MVLKGMIKRVYCPLGGLSNQRLGYKNPALGGGQTVENYFLDTNYTKERTDLRSAQWSCTLGQ